MKLYTEEQVRNMLDTFLLFTGNEDANDYIEYMTPIELPSDEEINMFAHIQFPVNLQPIGRTLAGRHYDVDINYSERNAYILSAKNVINKIQAGNNEPTK